MLWNRGFTNFKTNSLKNETTQSLINVVVKLSKNFNKIMLQEKEFENNANEKEKCLHGQISTLCTRHELRFFQ